MSEKVYGFCGTNKCKREVVPKGEIEKKLLIVEIPSIQSGTTKSIQLPDGWTFVNTSLISKMFVRSDDATYNENYHTMANTDTLNVFIRNTNELSVYFKTTHTDHLSVKCRLILLKRDGIPTITVL